MSNYFKSLLPKSFRRLGSYFIALRPKSMRKCNICGFHGHFEHFSGPPLLNEVVCPECSSHSRHRLFWDWYTRKGVRLEEPIYHFAPEEVLEHKFRPIYNDYVTADLNSTADRVVDIQDISLADGSIGTVICNHVLEHVPDDRLAMKEIFRILKPSGILIASFPLIDGWDETYEDSTITSGFDRAIHFGQCDHLRIYGRDVRMRLSEAGFSNIEEITAYGVRAVELGLLRGEKIFVCSK